MITCKALALATSVSFFFSFALLCKIKLRRVGTTVVSLVTIWENFFLYLQAIFILFNIRFPFTTILWTFVVEQVLWYSGKATIWEATIHFRVSIQVPATPHPIQISANAFGKTADDGPTTWVPWERLGWSSWVLTLVWPSPELEVHLGEHISEWKFLSFSYTLLLSITWPSKYKIFFLNKCGK